MTDVTLMYQYHKGVHPARRGLMASEGVRFFVAEADPRRLHAFLLFWTGFSVSMTNQVEHWISGAGQSCKKMGIDAIGSHLERHAEHEAGHDQMLVADLHVLVDLWNQKYGGHLQAKTILAVPPPPSTLAYIKLHEETIQGSTPFGQVAIEYEVERLSVVVGQRWIDNVVYTLGQEFEAGLTFLVEHVLLDQGHTQFNGKLMENSLLEDPTRLNAMIETGSSALRIYAQFLGDCVAASELLMEGNLGSHIPLEA